MRAQQLSAMRVGFVVLAGMFFTLLGPAKPVACVDAYLIGVHGVAEGPDPVAPAVACRNPKGVYGDAPELVEIWNGFVQAAKAANKSVDHAYVTYHAPGFTTFLGSINDLAKAPVDMLKGVDELNKRIENVRTACPSQHFVLVGYSFGAWVIDEWFRENINRPNVDAVVLYGDPLWYRSGQDGTYEGVIRAFARIVTDAISPQLAPALQLAIPLPPDPYKNNPPGPGNGISDRWQTRCLQNDPICGEGYGSNWWNEIANWNAIRQLNDARRCLDTDCNHLKYTWKKYDGCGMWKNEYNYGDEQDAPTTVGASFLASMAFQPVTASAPSSQSTPRPLIPTPVPTPTPPPVYVNLGGQPPCPGPGCAR